MPRSTPTRKSSMPHAAHLELVRPTFRQKESRPLPHPTWLPNFTVRGSDDGAAPARGACAAAPARRRRPRRTGRAST
eukprot:scaffold116574_cov76-Phaeocystis_antarctica.AAC.1